MYSNREVYLCNAVLVMKIFCYQYSTFNNSAVKFEMEFGDHLYNLLGIECT